jgi:hypothetical protein
MKRTPSSSSFMSFTGKRKTPHKQDAPGKKQKPKSTLKPECGERVKRFKFSSFVQQLENISIDHFQKRSGFIGLKPSNNSSWFHSSIIAWLDINMTSSFKGFYRKLEGILKGGSVPHLLLAKDQIVESLLESMLNDDKSFSASVVFTHLLAMLAKDLGEELFPAFTTIWSGLNSLLSSSILDNSEVVESIITCQMFYLRIYQQPLLDNVQKFGYFFIQKLLKSPKSLVKVSSNTLAYFVQKAPTIQVKSLFLSLELGDKKLFTLLLETLLVTIKGLGAASLELAFFNEQLAKEVCIKSLISPEIDFESFWKILISLNPSTDILSSCLALRKGSRVRFQKEILTSRIPFLDESIDSALFLAMLLKSCNVNTILTLRSFNQSEQIQKIDKQALRVFLQGLDFDLWQVLEGCLNLRFVEESFEEYDLTLEGRILKFIEQPTVESCEFFVTELHPIALTASFPLPLHFLHLCLASHDSNIVLNALSKLPFEGSIKAKLVSISSVPSDLDRYREKINLLASLELLINDSISDDEATVIFYYLLGACHIKFSLIMPTVGHLLNILSQRRPKLFPQIWLHYLTYLRDQKRLQERYDINLAPAVECIEKSIDSTLGKLPSLKARVSAISTDKKVRFGEKFFSTVKTVDYSIISQSEFGNVLKVLALAHSACNLLDLNDFINVKHLEESPFKVSLQKNLLSLLCCYSKSCNINRALILDEYLPMGDDSIQRASLDTLYPGNNSEESNYWPKSFKNLLAENTYRDELVVLCERREFLFSDRQTMEILIRLIYGRLISKKLAKNKSAMQVRRKALLGFIAIWPVEFIIKFTEFIRPSAQDAENVWTGYLSLLQFVIQYLPVIPDVLDSIFESIVTAPEFKKTKSLVMKRVLQLLKKASYFPIDSALRSAYSLVIEPLLERLSFEYTQSESFIFEVLYYASSQSHLKSFIITPSVIDSLIKCLESDSINTKVLLKLISTLDNLIDMIPSRQSLLERIVKVIQKYSGLASKSDQISFLQSTNLCLKLCQSVNSNSAVVDVKILLTSFLPLLKLKKVRGPIKASILQSAASLFPFSDCSDISLKYFEVACNLLIENTLLATPLISLVGSLAINDAAYDKSFFVMQEVFSRLAGKLEEVDYDRRAQLFSAFAQDPSQLNEQAHKILTFCCLSFVLNEVDDFSSRNQSLTFLSNNMQLVVEHYLSYLPRAFQHTNETVRLDYCALLSKAIPCSDKLKDLTPLLFEENEEADVFGNLTHLQQHRKIRAIRRLVLGIPNNHWLVPHFINFLMNWAINRPNQTSAINPALQQEAGKAIGELSAKCSFKQAFAKLSFLERLIVKTPETERSALKVIPFILKDIILDPLLVVELPKLMRLMKHQKNTTELVRIPLAFSIVQLLVRLEKASLLQLDNHLPSIMSALITSLKSKSEDVRKDARKAIQSIITLLDDPAQTISNLIRELHSVMEPGYQRHVMIYTVNSVLSDNLTRDDQIGDRVFDLLCLLIREDLFGRLAEERSKSEWTGKTLEAKQCKGFDLIASVFKIMSPTRLESLLNVLRAGYYRHEEKHRKNFDKMTNVIVNGIERLDLLELMINISNPEYYTNDNTERWQLLGLKACTVLIKKYSNNARLTADIDSNLIQSFKEIAITHLFGIQNALTLCSLKFISYSLAWEGYYDDELKRKILQRAFELVVKCGQPELVSECFKYISLIIRYHTTVSVTEQQIKALLVYTRSNFESLEGQQLLFTLIKSVLNYSIQFSKYPLELYELMGDLYRSMISSHHSITRQHCRVLFVHFLGHCPLSASKLGEHVERLLSDSLNYEHLSGRNSAREALILLVTKIPLETWQEMASKMLLTLTTSFAKEAETAGHELIKKLYSELLCLKSDSILALLSKMLAKWLDSDQPSIAGAAQKTASCLLQAYPDGKGIERVLYKKILQNK